MAKLNRQQIVREAISKQYEGNKRQLARKLRRQYPSVFSSIEDARGAIRYQLGANGKRDREHASKVDTGNLSFRQRIPETKAQKRVDYYIDGPCGIVILNDIHAGMHDPDALDVALKWVSDNKRYIDYVVLSDFWDGYELSPYLGDPHCILWEEEVEIGHEILSLIDEASGGAQKILKEGNHDDRLERYILRNANLLHSQIQYLRENIYEYNKRGVIYVEGKRRIRAGHLRIVHGHEFKMSHSPIGPARVLFMKTGKSVICGHFHRTSDFMNTDIDGKPRECYSTGCLCSFDQPYITEGDHNWNHGFAFVELFEDGNFNVRNMKIYQGKVIG